MPEMRPSGALSGRRSLPRSPFPVGRGVPPRTVDPRPGAIGGGGAATAAIRLLPGCAGAAPAGKRGSGAVRRHQQYSPFDTRSNDSRTSSRSTPVSFIDTDYNEESFVRHACFLGANDLCKALRTTLKAEIDADAWALLHRDVSRPFDRPASGRIAVKVINRLGDEVMKVFRVRVAMDRRWRMPRGQR